MRTQPQAQAGVRLPPEWLEELQRRAHKHERTVSAEIRLAVRRYLAAAAEEERVVAVQEERVGQELKARLLRDCGGRGGRKGQ